MWGIYRCNRRNNLNYKVIKFGRYKLIILKFIYFFFIRYLSMFFFFFIGVYFVLIVGLKNLFLRFIICFSGLLVINY